MHLKRTRPCCQCPSHTFSNQPLMKMFFKGCRSLAFHRMCCKCRNQYLMRMFSKGYQTIMIECFIHLKKNSTVLQMSNHDNIFQGPSISCFPWDVLQMSKSTSDDNIFQGMSISYHPHEEGRHTAGKLFTQLEPQNHWDFSPISHKGIMTTIPESAFLSS